MTKNDLYGILHRAMKYSSYFKRSSAEELLRRFMKPNYSVVDFGCGTGEWLKVARDMGADVVQGVETEFDSIEPIDVPVFYGDLASDEIDLGRKFDIGICVEVAEHLPPESAKGLVGNIARHCDMVIFPPQFQDKAECSMSTNNHPNIGAICSPPKDLSATTSVKNFGKIQKLNRGIGKIC
jgi:SAM-dependent methyltransferase